MVEQVVQIVGSLLVLSGFIAAQTGRLDPSSAVYLVVNLAGSGVLAVDALVTAQWGFLLLEGVWAVVSAVGLVRAVRTSRRTGSPSSRERAASGSASWSGSGSGAGRTRAPDVVTDSPSGP